MAARGFWQVHPGAASTFLSRVTALLEARPGDRVIDLYAGSACSRCASAISSHPTASSSVSRETGGRCENGVVNTEHLDNVEWRANRVDRELRSLVGQDVVTADLAVLDPPRTGAGKDVMGCSPDGSPPGRLRRVRSVALARDVKAAATHGYGLVSLEAWDAFPMTHHVECIAVLELERADDAAASRARDDVFMPFS